MNTVAEALAKLSELKNEKAILSQVVEYLDGTFLNEGMVLLTEDRLPVPQTEIEKFVEKISEMQKQNASAISDVLTQSVGPQKAPKKE